MSSTETLNPPNALAEQAEMIVRDFAKIRDGERVAVFFDGSHSSEAGALVEAAKASGAEAIGIDISQAVEALLRADSFWLPISANIVAAAEASNVSLFCVDETFAFRLDHKVATTFETSGECSIYKLDAGMGSWKMTAAEVAAVERNCEQIIAAMEGAQDVRVSSPAGTDLRLSLEGRACLPILPVPERGKPYGLSIPLWGELNWAPIEGSAEGVIVVDGLTEAGATMRTVREPVVMKVSAGRVREVTGGEDAEEFERVLAADAGSSMVGELGVGANPHAISGRESEKAKLGTVHFGFGNNLGYPGGQNESLVHVDGVVREVSLLADGRPVLERGQLAG